MHAMGRFMCMDTCGTVDGKAFCTVNPQMRQLGEDVGILDEAVGIQDTAALWLACLMRVPSVSYEEAYRSGQLLHQIVSVKGTTASVCKR